MMTRTLFTKVYRAMWGNKRAYIACMFLIAVGIMMRTAMGVASDGLMRAKLDFYNDYNLAHVFATVGAISNSDADRLRNIDGVRDVTARTKIEVRAEIDGNNEIITLRLISFDPAEGDERINNFQMTGLTPAANNEIAVNRMFMEANELEPGDNITIIHQGRGFDFAVTGSFLSPEYVYIARSATDILPDNAAFGIAHITHDAMVEITGRQGLNNDILFILEDGYELDDLRLVLMDALQPHGLISLTAREDQLSYSILDMQVEAVAGIAVSMPLVFMGMAAVVLYLMMKRIIEQERTQIGTLKAFGYSNGAVVFHYICYGVIVGLFGGLFGFLMGASASSVYLAMFLEFYVLPEIEQPLSASYLVFALLVSLGTGVFGAFMGAIRVAKIIPAEAMRPESPKPVKFDILAKIKPIKYMLTSRGQMAVRSISRNPIRSSFVVLGVTFSFALLAVFGSMESLMDAMIYAQFTDQRLYNVRVTLAQPVEYNQAIESAFAVRHITHAEGLMEMPVFLSHQHLQVGAVIVGVPSDAVLYQIFDTTRRTVHAPPREGIIITNGLADGLNAVAGDILYVRSPLFPLINGFTGYVAVPITRVIEQSMGTGAYMEITSLGAMFEHRPVVTSLIFNTDNIPYIMQYFRTAENVTTIDDKDTSLRKYIELMEPYMGIFMMLNLMGVAVAFAIIYNTSTISLSERKREYATLRVLGLSSKEVCEIMGFEYWTLSIMGMIVGVPLASVLMAGVNNMMDTALFSMPTTLPPVAYVTGVVGCGVAVMLSNFSARRKIAKFDMVEVLKEF